uniref:Reverse transcriptase domain-containing protein n=1 Tax=Amphimedon queenslandica TaxID=400682 RepID=A0A1X7UCE7_AMPQE
MDQVLLDLDFAYAYIDVLIVSSSHDEQVTHLYMILRRFNEHGIVINPIKCEFGVTQITFLGHLVNSCGICPHSDKVEAICSFPRPSTPRKLCEFPRLNNFYNCFLPNCACILCPLYSLLGKS